MIKVVAFALVLAGCLIKPDRVTGDGGAQANDVRPTDGDGSGSGSGEFKVRLISTAYYGVHGGSTTHQTAGDFQLTTAGILPGDLVFLIGNVDGDVGFMDVGAANGFTKLTGTHFGPNAGQTYVALVKAASATEPPGYSGSYDGATTTGYSAFALLAISNASMTGLANVSNHDGCVMSCNAAPAIVKMTASPVDTTANDSLIIYAAGADWLGANEHAVFAVPNGTTELLEMTDEGMSPNNFEKSTLMIASAIQHLAGTSEAYDGATTNNGPGTTGGLAWTITIAIAPR